MTKTAIRPINLESLEQLSQQRLQEQLPNHSPLQVRCYLRDETLVMLVEHPQPVLPYPHVAFRLFEQILEEDNLSGRYRGLMYLRMQGQPQPYAFHISKVEPQHREALPEEETETSAIAIHLEDLPEEESPLPPLPDPSQDLEDEEAEVLATEPRLPKQSWLPMILTGVGLSATIFFSSLYLLSRPCVLRQCEEIPFAQELAQKSLTTLQDPQSGKQILYARVQLNQALKLLQSIPSWSKHRSEAQNLLKRYQGISADLNALVEALQTGSKASTLTQNRPFPVSQWEEAQKTWEEAIAGLENIPTDSQFHNFAQQKLREYRRNLATVERGTQAEREATANLAAATDAATTAKVRQDIAQSVDNLQLAHTLWQTAINRLRQIPKGTTAYERAQLALKQYSSKLGLVRDLKTQEVFATNTYNQALRSAQLAKNAQTANQWSEAVVNWRNALESVKQVPNNTFNYAKAQSLVASYTQSLTQAEAKLKRAIVLQQARNDLDRLCTNSSKVCHYTLNKNVIQVRLTPTYMQEVRTRALQAQTAGDLTTHVKLLDHIYTLERALETISNNVGIRLEVYASNNALVQSHIPGQ